MKSLAVLIALAIGQTIGLAQYSFSTDFSQTQDFTQGVGTTGWLGAYGGNNPNSTFESSDGQLTIEDNGGHWENSDNSGHLLYVSVTGDFTAECLLTSLSTSSYATAGLGAFDPSITTASPTFTWIGAFEKGFYSGGTIGTRYVVNGSQTDDQGVATGINSDPIYLEMVRTGDVFTQYFSENGTDFTEIDSITMSTLPETLDVGLWDASYSGNTSTSVFSSFSVTEAPEPGVMALMGMGLAALLALRRGN